MDKETMIKILNQHGIDVLYDIVSDEVSNAYDQGYGFGRCIATLCEYSTNKDNCDKSYDKGYETGYHDRYGFVHDED